jgi:hypothetical protein
LQEYKPLKQPIGIDYQKYYIQFEKDGNTNPSNIGTCHNAMPYGGSKKP